MPLALKRLMLVSRNVQFAIDLKRALEALGEYRVTTVVGARNAIEVLRDNPQRLILLDTSDLTIAPEIMIEMMRARQSDIALVLAPDNDRTRQLVAEYALDGLVDIPVMARTLLPILEAALEAARPELRDADGETELGLDQDTIAIEALVEDSLAEDLALNYTRRRLQASYELLHPRVETTVSRPAVEILVEPEGAATVRSQSSSGGESESLRALAASANPSAFNAIAADARGQSGARSEIADADAFERMLSAFLDESTDLNNLTLDSLFDTTRELPGALGTGVVPAWLKATEAFIREPGFLREHLPALDELSGLGETTVPSPEIDAPPPQADRPEPAAVADSAEPAVEPPQPPPELPLSRRERDPYLAQLALTMTQIVSELAVEATVLSRDGRIVAFSGAMALERFRELRRLIGDDWAAQPSQARIRYLRLPESGADYLLQSMTTVADYSLTMIFAGGMQLSEIRQLGDKMQSALSAEPNGDSAAPAGGNGSARPSAPAQTQPFAFVWILSDPALSLQKNVAEQLVFWLEVQLNGLGWTIHRLDVHQDFIYLQADAPGAVSPDDLARAVMERAERIAVSEDLSLPRSLWADAYMVLQPGRDFSERELERFLQFARA